VVYVSTGATVARHAYPRPSQRLPGGADPV